MRPPEWRVRGECTTCGTAHHGFDVICVRCTMRAPFACALPGTCLCTICNLAFRIQCRNALGPFGCGSVATTPEPQVRALDQDRDRAILAMVAARVGCAALGRAMRTTKASNPHAPRRVRERQLEDARSGLLEAGADPNSPFCLGLAAHLAGYPLPSVPDKRTLATPVRAWKEQSLVQPWEPPSVQPSVLPSEQPSEQPSGQPSRQPSGQHSGQHSVHHSGPHSETPSGQPSGQPSEQPSEQPTEPPSELPTVKPSVRHSAQPSLAMPIVTSSARRRARRFTLSLARPSATRAAQASAPSATRAAQASAPSAQRAAPPSARRAAQASAQASTQRAAQASAPHSTQRAAQASAPQSTQRAAQASAPQSAQRAAQASAPPSARRPAQASAPQSAQRAAQASAPPAEPQPAQRATQASATPTARQSAQRAAQASVQRAAGRSTRQSAQPSDHPSAKRVRKRAAPPSHQLVTQCAVRLTSGPSVLLPSTSTWSAWAAWFMSVDTVPTLTQAREVAVAIAPVRAHASTESPTEPRGAAVESYGAGEASQRVPRHSVLSSLSQSLVKVSATLDTSVPARGVGAATGRTSTGHSNPPGDAPSDKCTSEASRVQRAAPTGPPSIGPSGVPIAESSAWSSGQTLAAKSTVGGAAPSTDTNAPGAATSQHLRVSLGVAGAEMLCQPSADASCNCAFGLILDGYTESGTSALGTSTSLNIGMEPGRRSRPPPTPGVGRPIPLYREVDALQCAELIDRPMFHAVRFGGFLPNVDHFIPKQYTLGTQYGLRREIQLKLQRSRETDESKSERGFHSTLWACPERTGAGWLTDDSHPGLGAPRRVQHAVSEERHGTHMPTGPMGLLAPLRGQCAAGDERVETLPTLRTVVGNGFDPASLEPLWRVRRLATLRAVVGNGFDPASSDSLRRVRRLALLRADVDKGFDSESSEPLRRGRLACWATLRAVVGDCSLRWGQACRSIEPRKRPSAQNPSDGLTKYLTGVPFPNGTARLLGHAVSFPEVPES